MFNPLKDMEVKPPPPEKPATELKMKQLIKQISELEDEADVEITAKLEDIRTGLTEVCTAQSSQPSVAQLSQHIQVLSDKIQHLDIENSDLKDQLDNAQS